ncbi:MAG: hypothetical protein KBF45_06575 [Cyclobacteriaceae bacterium]|nr:hypothetical protein [Cyclobacteriaceae bacterium]
MSSDATQLTHSPLPKNARFIILIYLFGAPVLLMLADGLHYYHHYLIANVIFKTALVTFIVGSFGLTYLFPESAKYFGLAGTGLVALGSIMVAGMSTEILYQDILLDKGYKISDIKEFDQLLRSTDAMRVIYLPTGFAFPLGLVVLSIGIFRSPYTPRYISIILCVGALFHTVARMVNHVTLLLLSEGILLVASSLTGWFMWRYTPDQLGVKK